MEDSGSKIEFWACHWSSDLRYPKLEMMFISGSKATLLSVTNVWNIKLSESESIVGYGTIVNLVAESLIQRFWTFWLKDMNLLIDSFVWRLKSSDGYELLLLLASLWILWVNCLIWLDMSLLDGTSRFLIHNWSMMRI